MTFLKRRSETLVARADGAIGDGSGPAAVGAVLIDNKGRVVRLGNRRLRPMTNNEAEYAGLLLALELAVPLQPKELQVFLDSQVVVGQMNGNCAVRSTALQAWHRKVYRMALRLPKVSYTHVPRERNRLADALANEALQGQMLHIL